MARGKYFSNNATCGKEERFLNSGNSLYSSGTYEARGNYLCNVISFINVKFQVAM